MSYNPDIPCSIYVIQNTRTGVMYIGQSQRPEVRMREHRRVLNAGAHVNTEMQRSYTKWGPEAFEFEKLETHPTRADSNIAEKFLIGYLRFLGAKLYNLREGGDASAFPQSLRLRFSAMKKGKPVHPAVHEGFRRYLQTHGPRKHSEETKRKMSIARKGRKPSAACIEASRRISTGRVMSAESRQKMRLAHLGVELSPSHREAQGRARKGQHRGGRKRDLQPTAW